MRAVVVQLRPVLELARAIFLRSSIVRWKSVISRHVLFTKIRLSIFMHRGPFTPHLTIRNIDPGLAFKNMGRHPSRREAHKEHSMSFKVRRVASWFQRMLPALIIGLLVFLGGAPEAKPNKTHAIAAFKLQHQ